MRFEGRGVPAGGGGRGIGAATARPLTRRRAPAAADNRAATTGATAVTGRAATTGATAVTGRAAMD